MNRAPQVPASDPKSGEGIAQRAYAQEEQERRTCSVLINELYFLHSRLGVLLARMIGREGNEPLRTLLMDHYAGGQTIAQRILDGARCIGFTPCPSANVIAAGLLEEVRYANHHKDPANGRPVALQIALRTLHVHGIYTWGRLIDALERNGPAQLQQEALALQTLEAGLYKALAALSLARSAH